MTPYMVYISAINTHITIVRIEFSPLGLIDVSNGHQLETTGKDNKAQLVQTSEILNYCNLQL